MRRNELFPAWGGTAMTSLEAPPICHYHLPLPFGRRHPASSGTDSHYAMGSPYGSLTRSYICCCMPIFVFPAPYGVSLDGGQDARTHQRRDFVLPVIPDSPVIFSAVPTSETQRVSPAEAGLLSVPPRRDQIYGARQQRIEDFVPCVGVA